MMFLLRKLAVVAVVGCMPALAHAQSYSGAGGDIPDNNPATPLTSIITVPDSFLIADVTVSIEGLAHTWQGDIWARVTAPDGTTTIDLFRRANQGTGSTFGNGSDFLATNTYLWSDAGSVSTWSAANPIASGVYRGFTNPGADIGSGAGTPEEVLTSFSIFDGMNAQGDWTLRISDHASGLAGSATGWTINFTAIPEPASLGLLALAAPALLLRRRR